MAKYQNNVVHFNEYVVEQVDTLASRGETSSDVLVNLFKGYSVCSDAEFRRYIADKRTRYDEGDSYTVQELMHLARNKYTLLTDSGRWSAPSQEEEKIIAMQAQISDLKRSAQKPSGGRGGRGGGGRERGGRGGGIKHPPPGNKVRAPPEWDQHPKPAPGQEKYPVNFTIKKMVP